MKNLKLILPLCFISIVYSIISFLLEKVNPVLIYNKFSIILSIVIVVGLIIVNLLINNQLLNKILLNYKNVLFFSLIYSFLSAITIFISRILLSIFSMGVFGLKESIFWFLLFLIIGFIFFFIIYFILFTCFKRFKKGGENQ